MYVLKFKVFFAFCTSLLCLSLHVTGQIKEDDSDPLENIYRSPIRKILNKFSINFGSGLGYTNYKHDLEGLLYYQDDENQLVVDPDNELLSNDQLIGSSNWFSNPMLSDTLFNGDIFDVPFSPISNPVNNPLLSGESLLLNADSVGLRFSQTSSSIPLFLSVHYNYQQFRIGIGFQLTFNSIKEFTPNTLENRIRDYQPPFTSYTSSRFFGTVGYRFYDWWNYSFAAEIQLGSINNGKQFNEAFIDQGLFANIGISIEKHFSEYLRLIVKPSFDFKSYNLNLPESGTTIQHNYPAYFLQIGFSLNIPEIPRSPIPADHIQLKHVITHPDTGVRMEVRGQPLWKWQNPKVGQNHRKLWRNKRKNRKKLDPY